jgi:glycosyltransferase involved in cell wall biosynthesis
MKVSVCIATYNGSKYILQQLASILMQLSPMDEVIVSDDFSTDNTVRLIEDLNDARVRVYFNNNAKGYTKNFENALIKATGDIIFLSDQDDIWVGDKVKKMMKALSNASMVVSDAQVVDETLHILQTSHFRVHGTSTGFFINFVKTRYIGACMAFKREVLLKALPFPKNQFLCAHDYWLAMVAEFFFNVQMVDEPLLLYRRHGKNASTGGSHSSNSLGKIIKTRAYVFGKLLGRINK